MLHAVNIASQNDLPDPRDLEQWWTDADFRIARTIADIDSTRYLAEAVPFHYVDFGSSAMAAALGARMEFVDRETVWAYPTFGSIEEVAEIVLDRSNRYYRLLRELTVLSSESAARHHFTTLFALGAPGDTTAALYGTERLLIDMIERPASVERAMERMKRIWIECFDEFNGLIGRAGNDGAVGWAGVWAPGTTFPIQEDFSYMISPEMYRRFCLPHIADMTEAMAYPMYHLDGVGAIPHLDALLELGRLRVIQWVPGAGREDLAQWHGLIRRILETGRSVQLFARAEEIDPLIDAVGATGLLVTVTDASPSTEERLRRRFDLE